MRRDRMVNRAPAGIARAILPKRHENAPTSFDEVHHATVLYNSGIECPAQQTQVGPGSAAVAWFAHQFARAEGRQGRQRAGKSRDCGLLPGAAHPTS